MTGQLELNVTVGTPAQIGGMKGGGSGAIVNGVYTVYFGYFQATSPTSQYGSFTIDVGGSGGGGRSSEAAAAAPTFEIAFSPTDGTTCSNSNQSGTGGTWITLPSASDCTPPATKPNAKLLGWATSPSFPVVIAKRQVDNGWGAYETFNADGQLTGVFIPAGGATFLSATGNIYPIWNQ